MTAHGNPESDVDAFIKAQPVARLATADANGNPHVVPICYVYDGRCLYTPLDLKLKNVPVLRFKRVRNIAENPKVAVVVDHYSDDWSLLGSALIRGSASVLEEGNERARAEAMLREKYPQYEELLACGCPIVRVLVVQTTSWGNLQS